MPLFLLYLSNIGDILATSFKWTYSRICKCQKPNKKNDTAIVGVLKRPDTFRVKALAANIHNMPTEATQQESNSSTASGDPSSAPRPENGTAADADLISVYSEYLEDAPPIVKTSNAPNSLDNVTVPISLCLAVMVSYICGGALLFGQWEGWGFLDGSYFCFITLSTIGFGDIVPGDALSADDDETSSGVLGVVNTKFVLCSMYILIGMAVIAMCFSLMQEKVVQGVRSMGKKIGIIKE